MISCQVCGNVNPFTTRFCRKCGAKLELQVSQVADALDRTKATSRDDAVFRAGRSALSLALFLGVCALCLRYLLVPAMPIADLPPLPVPTLLPAQLSAVSVASAAPAGRLAWRHDHVEGILSTLGIDLVHLEAWQKAVLLTQREDGSFSGGDPLAATGLAALALQAYPTDDACVAAAARARTALHAKLGDLELRPALARTLAVAALLDAEDLTGPEWGATKAYLEDGHAAPWQAFALALVPADERSSHLDLLSATSTDPVWKVLMAQVTNDPDPVPSTGPNLFSGAAVSLPSGEERLLWAFTAWQVPATPADLTSVLGAWSRAAAAPIAPETASACGPLAESEVAILTLCAPAHVLPLWFVH
jgi:hypothetical protein